MSTNVLLLDQISPFLESQFSELPIDLQEKLSLAGMGEKTNKKYCSEVEEFDWVHIEAGNKLLTDEEAKVIEEGDGIRKGKGIRSKIKTEHYYIWDTLSALEREYKVARYDFENCPNHREKAASSKLAEAITLYLITKFSDLPQEMRMNIAYVDIFQKWDEISTGQRKQMAHDFDARMQPDYENSVNQYCDWELERQSIPDQIFNWQRLNPNGIASEQIIIDTKIKELEEREIELKELLGYSNSNNEQESKQISIAHSPDRGAARGIDKRKVMAAFKGIKWDYYHWGKNLASPSKKLEGCRVARGNKTASAIWNPVEIGLYLLDEGEKLEKLNAVFFKLKDWTGEWQEKTELERD
ncbi:hypothetical protein C8R27_11361 [Nitrosomonas ureae]|uniref:hypothetical protein n=1 Tax=Nitrosomonas ureae TaxID=44577 RepID=UPI000D76A322|nr:hypothetical protein [Nitrosomonas ureae]PXX14777.1 hypothetical protein C8R27_11361 [Nitrosomonas ureae]